MGFVSTRERTGSQTVGCWWAVKGLAPHSLPVCRRSPLPLWVIVGIRSRPVSPFQAVEEVVATHMSLSHTLTRRCLAEGSKLLYVADVMCVTGCRTLAAR